MQGTSQHNGCQRGTVTYRCNGQGQLCEIADQEGNRFQQISIKLLVKFNRFYIQIIKVEWKIGEVEEKKEEKSKCKVGCTDSYKQEALNVELVKSCTCYLD